MKFGGTSLGDAASIERALEIIQASSRDSRGIVVVSAMSGVTDQLFEAARRSATGDLQSARATLENVRKRHERAIETLIHSPANKRALRRKVRACLLEGERSCQVTTARGELTPRASDLISSLGERLSAPLVAAALSERGLASQAVEATELLITDCRHGSADPQMKLTCEQCEAHLRPLLERGAIPVVTGYLGATPDGAVTTLGRGGSDYSATILGTALEAAEVVIWTDVDGVLTADPRWVPEASLIPEISYREAATLAYFGAKVLHPKTLQPLLKRNIRVWIRNTFAAGRPGTQIIPSERLNGGGAKALAAISEATLIEVRSRANGRTQEKMQSARAALARAHADVLLLSQTSPEGDFCLAVHSSKAEEAIDALSRTFGADPCVPVGARVILEKGISVVTVVGEPAGENSGLARAAVGVMRRESLQVIAGAQDISDYSFSFALAREDMKKALVALHREFHLESRKSQLQAPTSDDGASRSADAMPLKQLRLEESRH